MRFELQMEIGVRPPTVSANWNIPTPGMTGDDQSSNSLVQGSLRQRKFVEVNVHGLTRTRIPLLFYAKVEHIAIIVFQIVYTN